MNQNFRSYHTGNKAFRHIETLFVQGNQVRTDQNKPPFLVIKKEVCFDQYELDYLGRIKFLHVECLIVRPKTEEYYHRPTARSITLMGFVLHPIKRTVQDLTNRMSKISPPPAPLWGELGEAPLTYFFAYVSEYSKKRKYYNHLKHGVGREDFVYFSHYLNHE